jgi:AcrR family transcriptional regulator
MPRTPSHGRNLARLPPRPRTKPPEVRREELMDAAERILVDKGVAATSVDEIVSAADVAKGTFYIHFESKERLLLSLQQRFVDTFCRDLKAAMNRRRAGDWHGRLRAWVETSIDVYLDRAALHDVVFHQFRPDDPGAKHDNPIVDELAEFLGEGTRAGAWSVGAPRLTAVMLFHALHGALHEGIEARESANRRRLSRSLEVFFHRAVGLV